MRGMIRRMLAAAAAGARWVVTGGEDADGNVETDELEVFGVAGVASRPAGEIDVMVLRVGGGGHAVIVGSCNRSTMLSALGADLAADEIAVYNTKSFVRITADGDVLIGRADGTFERVATESHVHGPGTFANSGGAVTGLSGGAAGAPVTGRGLAAVAKAET